MEVQISPVYSNSAQSLLIPSQQISNCNVDVTERKRFKSDLTFHCILCSDVYDDPNVLYEHMKVRHPQLYEHDELKNMIEEDDEDKSSDNSDEEYEYNVSIMEPICELKQADDEMETNDAVQERSTDEVDDDDDDDDNSTGTGTTGVLLRLPQGPGRGRRRDIDNERLETTQQVGTCFFQCTQCEKSYKFSGDLAKHVRSHTLNKPYQCSICQKT